MRPATFRWTRLVLIAVICLSYAPVLVGLVKDWIRDSNYSHGFLIPPISAFLIWRRRKELEGLATRPAGIGVLGVLFAGGMLIVASAGSEVFTQRVSLVVLLIFLAVFLYGWAHARVVSFPLAFLLFAIPLPYVIYYGLTAPMQAFAAKCALATLRAVGIPAVGQGNIIHLPRISLEVAEACSGIRSLYAFLAVGALLASSTQIPIWGRISLFLATIPLAIAGNALRVFGSGLGAWLIGPEATRGTIHEIFGLLMFGIILGLFLIMKKAIGVVCASDGRSPSLSSRYPGPTRPDSG